MKRKVQYSVCNYRLEGNTSDKCSDTFLDEEFSSTLRDRSLIYR